MSAPRKLELRDGQRADPRDVPDRKVDLTEQQHEDDAESKHRRSGHLDDDVPEVDRGEEVRCGQPEEDDDEQLSDDDREDPEVPRPDIGQHTGAEARRRLTVAGGLRHGLDDLGCAHGAVPAVEGMPATLVGVPAVIAATISCWEVVARSKTPTLRPSRKTVILSAVSKMS